MNRHILLRVALGVPVDLLLARIGLTVVDEVDVPGHHWGPFLLLSDRFGHVVENWVPSFKVTSPKIH